VVLRTRKATIGLFFIPHSSFLIPHSSFFIRHFGSLDRAQTEMKNVE